MITLTIEEAQHALRLLAERALQGDQVFIRIEGTDELLTLQSVPPELPPELPMLRPRRNRRGKLPGTSCAQRHRHVKQWDIFLFPFPEELPHPVVIVSSDDRHPLRKETILPIKRIVPRLHFGTWKAPKPDCNFPWLNPWV